MPLAAENEVLSVLSILAFAEESSKCPLGVFSTQLRDLLRSLGDGVALGDALAERSLSLAKEEESLNAEKEVSTLAYEKLRAELTRVELQLQDQKRRLEEVRQQKSLCRIALNSVVSGEVQAYYTEPHAQGSAGAAGARSPSGGRAPRDEDEETHSPSSAPEPTPVRKEAVAVREKHGSVATAAATAPSSTSPLGAETPASTAPPARRSGGGSGGSGGAASLLTLLRLPDVKESALQQAMESYEQNTFASDAWTGPDAPADFVETLLALARHLPEPRPPIQLVELRILGRVLQAPAAGGEEAKSIARVIGALVQDGALTANLTKLLNSVNDDVKCEALECLSPLVCLSHSVLNSSGNQQVCTAARREFLQCKGVEPLVNIVVCSTSEAVLERALVFLWGILAKDEKTDAQNNDGKAIRAQVRELGGLRAVLDLLYTDSLAILENVCMVIGYITREDASKTEIREIGGLEKITATLRHPSDSIKTKMAGAVWNCASNSDNRAYLRQLGTIPVLLELLLPDRDATEADSAYEFVRENAAGALWNLSVDVENKKQLLDYGGIPTLVRVISRSRSVAVVENVSGTLWNCSAAVETRPAIRKAGGIPVLLSVLDGSDGDGRKRDTSDKILDNIAGTLRNCAINDLNKPVIQQSGGVELILKKLEASILGKASAAPKPLPQSTIDKLAATLWILTISPEIKQSLKGNGGIGKITQMLESCSPTMAAAAAARKTRAARQPLSSASLFPPPPHHAAARPAKTAAEYCDRFFSPAVLKAIPSAQPACSISMGTKEKLVGILRNCSTIPENRKAMVASGAVAVITSVVLDCYSELTVFQTGGGTSHKSASRLAEPSAQLKETAASALWYLSREDKVAPREQGGLELMCMFLVSPNQPPVVLEQAAGALSSLTVNNAENRDLIRERGGLKAALELITDRAAIEYPAAKGTKSAEQAPASSQTVSVLNALLTVRNSLVNNEENLRLCAEEAAANKNLLVTTMLYLVERGSEECAREAALTMKNLCASPAVQELFLKCNAAQIVTQLSEKTQSDSVRRAASNALQSLGLKK